MKKKLVIVLLAVALALSLGLVPAASVEASPGPGLVGLWHFDEGSGQTAGDVTGVNNGYLGFTTDSDDNDPSWTTDGKFGNALSFDGSDDYVTVPDSDSLDIGTSDFTIEAWVKLSDNGLINSMIVDKRAVGSPYTGYCFYFQHTETNNYLRAQVNTTSSMLDNCVDVGSDLRDGTWHHLAFAVDRDSVTGGIFYLDGSPAGTPQDFSAQTGDISNAVDLTIGRSLQFEDDKTEGIIDEVRIWNEALSASQIGLSPSSVTWLPPVTNRNFTLKKGSTLPLKFQLCVNDTPVTTMQPVSLTITGPNGFTPITFQLGKGVKYLRWNDDGSYYIANLKSKGWPLGEYTATVSDIATGGNIVTGEITFTLAAKGNRGNSGK